MKKILFGILTFLGIGLSFCSAEEYTITFNVGTNVSLYDYISESSKIGVFSINSVDSNISTGFANFPFLYLTGYNPLYTINLKSVCYYDTSRLTTYYFFNNPSNSSKVSSDYILCFNLTGYNLKENPIPLFYSTNSDLSRFRVMFNYGFSTSLSSYGYSFNYSTYNLYKFSLPTLNDNLPNFSFYYSGYGSYNRFVIPLSVVIEYTPPPTPKFKVNYGNTSYEYTLEDNLEIRLNSPVLKDGDNYSYDGSTGINLFYNGTSQRYNKSELYLFTPSWYSNNIFTPICL